MATDQRDLDAVAWMKANEQANILRAIEIRKVYSEPSADALALAARPQPAQHGGGNGKTDV
jgi:hypothetical protein